MKKQTIITIAVLMGLVFLFAGHAWAEGERGRGRRGDQQLRDPAAGGHFRGRSAEPADVAPDRDRRGQGREIHRDPLTAWEYTARGNLVAVITNGTAVLGLGDIGPLASKPVMEGKAVLFKRFADIDVFDIELDTHDPKEIIHAVKLMEPTFGGINLEDIKAPECFEVEERLIEELNIPVEAKIDTIRANLERGEDGLTSNHYLSDVVGLLAIACALLVLANTDPSQAIGVFATVALAVAFGTVAIPLAFDARWTTAAWCTCAACRTCAAWSRIRPSAWTTGANAWQTV